MRITELNNWEFKSAAQPEGYHQPFLPRDEWRPAQVPGHIHTDLVRHGIIAEPFVGQAELGCQWVDRTPWTYQTSFEWHPTEEFPYAALEFEGLDASAHVTINDDLPYALANMFRQWTIRAAKPEFIEGTNHVQIAFDSAYTIGVNERSRYFHDQGLDWYHTGFFDERAFVRKAQYMSGWDWGPRLISCGIWKPVRLLEYKARILSFEVFQEQLEDGQWRVWSKTEIEGDADLVTQFDGQQFDGDFDITLEDPKLWWPNGYGKAYLYKASAEISTGHRMERRIGLRTIKLVREKDRYGESFEFEVNGKPFWARGANWIPNDSFPSRITGSDYADQIEVCRKLNFNMLRVWGGGLYESEAFYDACDEAGILVWQDFPFACSYYPDDDAFCEEIRREATGQIKRLRHRASLAIWCGNNENLAMHEQRWAGDDTPARMHGDRIFSETLPSILQELDPHRPYIPTSPTGPLSYEDKCNEGRAGDQHYWDVWHGRGDWTHYAESTARFSSEFGFASSCSLAQWKDILKPEEWDYKSQTVRWHDKTGKSFKVWEDMVELHYPKSQTLEDWVYYSQLNQRDALRFAIEHYRLSSMCKGTLIWQFNDCWPVQSWAVQDYKRLLKPAGFELNRLHAQQMVAYTTDEHYHQIYIINSSLVDFNGFVVAGAWSTVSGELIETKKLPVKVPSGQSEQPLSFGRDLDPTSTLIRTEIEGRPASRSSYLLSEPKEMKLVKPEIAYSISGNTITLSIQGIAVDLIAYDPDDHTNLMPEGPLAGVAAQTLINENARFTFTHPPSRIVVRSLRGSQEIELAN